MIDGVTTESGSISDAEAPVRAVPSRALTRLYGRFGRRTIYVFTLTGVTAALATGLLGAFILGRYLGMSSGQQLTQIVVSEVASLVGSLSVFLATRDSIFATAAWSSGDLDGVQASAAWDAVASFPSVLISRRSMLPIAALTLAIGVFAVVNVGAPAWTALPVVAGGELAIVGAMMLLVFVAELLLRPMLEDIATHLPAGFEPSRHTWSLRAKTAVPLPLLTLGAVLAVGAFPVTSRTGGVRLAILFGIALPFVVIVTVIFLIVIRSVLDPVDDLMAATRRVRAGDLATQVPVVTTDELGVLGASFNQMLEGLREREALREEVLLREDELRASRARIVAASDAERRRVERNIHDGAQQQLVALAVKLRMLEERAGQDPELRVAIGQIADRLKGALDELRELARGLHPSVLTTDGLTPALEQLASRGSLPVTIRAPAERFPEAIESTAYFVACEALANVAKYAHASHAEVSIEHEDGRLKIRITDDGVGGAHANAGSGLTGLVDRVAALDGQLTVDSPAGHGTTVTAELPVP